MGIETIDLTPTDEGQVALVRMFAQDIIRYKVRKSEQERARILLAQIVDLAYIAGHNAAISKEPVVVTRRVQMREAVEKA